MDCRLLALFAITVWCNNSPCSDIQIRSLQPIAFTMDTIWSSQSSDIIPQTLSWSIGFCHHTHHLHCNISGWAHLYTPSACGITFDGAMQVHRFPNKLQLTTTKRTASNAFRLILLLDCTREHKTPRLLHATGEKVGTIITYKILLLSQYACDRLPGVQRATTIARSLLSTDTKCPPLPAVVLSGAWQGGTHSCVSNYQHVGANCTLVCADGYKASVAHSAHGLTLTCAPSGVWAELTTGRQLPPHLIKCQRSSCQVPPSPPGGSYSCRWVTDSNLQLYVCKLTCFSKDTIPTTTNNNQQNISATCVPTPAGPRWLHFPLTCAGYGKCEKKDCMIARGWSALDNRTCEYVNASMQCAAITECLTTQDIDYCQLFISKCGSNINCGISAADERCSTLRPGSIQGGEWRCTSEHCKLRCNKGYTETWKTTNNTSPTNPEYAAICSRGKWIYNIVSNGCRPVQHCGTPPVVNNGKWACTTTIDTYNQTICNLMCNQGFMPGNDFPVISCQLGRWKNSQHQTCQVFQGCTEPHPVLNGEWGCVQPHGQNTTVCKLQCNADFKQSSTNVVATCNSYNNWSNTNISCFKSVCDQKQFDTCVQTLGYHNFTASCEAHMTSLNCTCEQSFYKCFQEQPGNCWESLKPGCCDLQAAFRTCNLGCGDCSVQGGCSSPLKVDSPSYNPQLTTMTAGKWVCNSTICTLQCNTGYATNWLYSASTGQHGSTAAVCNRANKVWGYNVYLHMPCVKVEPGCLPIQQCLAKGGFNALENSPYPCQYAETLVNCVLANDGCSTRGIQAYKSQCHSVAKIATTLRCDLHKLQCKKLDGECVGYCQNGGLCHQTTNNGVQCDCADGWKGETCTTTTNKICTDTTCQNGGRLLVKSQQPTCYCKCTKQWTGDHCEIQNVCSSSLCKHGGTCVEGSDGPGCSCVSGWDGSFCEKQVQDQCTATTCKHGGTCSVEFGEAVCSCTSHYWGERCENKTASKPVEHECNKNGLTACVSASVNAVGCDKVKSFASCATAYYCPDILDIWCKTLFPKASSNCPVKACTHKPDGCDTYLYQQCYIKMQQTYFTTSCDRQMYQLNCTQISHCDSLAAYICPGTKCIAVQKACGKYHNN